MKVKLALVRSTGPAVDIVITADTSATVEDVALGILRTDPQRSGVDTSDGHRLTLAVGESTDAGLTPLDPDLFFSEAPIGSGFTASVVTTSGGGGARSGRPAAVLHVHSGPQAGAMIELPLGNTVIGRGGDADVVIDDPLISKRHARIEVGASIEIVDLNSANGIVVDGGLVRRLRVIPGQVMLLGDTEVSLAPLARPVDVDTVLERGGGILFNRSPRVETRYNGTEYARPQVPTESQPAMFPWPVVVSPMLLGLLMYSITLRPATLLIVLASPLMMLGNVVGQRTQTGKKLQREIQTFEEQFEDLEDELTRQRDVERRIRHEEAPAVAVVYEQAVGLGPLLWTRRPEHWNFLSLRLGTGRALSRNTVRESETDKGIPRYAHRVERLTDAFELIDDVPITEHLPLSGALGIAAPQAIAADIVRGVAVQLFGMHAPHELVTAAIVDPGWTRELEWLKWLPHTSSPRSPIAEIALADNQPAGALLLSALEEIVLERASGQAARRGPLRSDGTSMALGAKVGETADKGGGPGDLALVLFVSADAPVDRPRLTQLIERGPDVGIHTIFLSSTVDGLPAACRTFIDATRGMDDVRVGFVRAGEYYEKVSVDGVSAAHADAFARRLAPVIDASTVAEDSSDLPGSVSMLSLIGQELADQPGSVIERWRQNNSVIDRTGVELPRMKRAGSLRAFIGQGATDAISLDLRTHGPHALVGGTTGAGKSEFLQAWVLGMAAEYSPDRVTFLFVDYKGGSAFADCVDLPHCVGLVTDLSPHLVRRALTSLRAELHYRERLFNRKKAKDLLELEKRRDPDTPPALVLVIDEFAALAGEVPEFVDGVVDVAQRGRSLGIHLIMATQRPAGVIKDNLRANTNLRVALRMADESDSRDVVGEAIAAGFDPALPGRGIAKIGPGRLVPFQSAYAGGWSADAVTAAEVSIGELRFGPSTKWEADAGRHAEAHDVDLGPNDQKRLVRSFTAAAASAGIPAPRRPWLDELPPTVDILDLPVEGDSEITLGLADLPEHQRQDPMVYSPDRDGSMLVYGTSGAGKSALLRTIAVAAGLRPERGSATVYGLDFGAGALRSIESLPHVGSVISADDPERVQRLLRELSGVLDDRAKRFSEVNAATLSEYRQITGRDEHRILVLLDGFGAFKTDWDSSTVRLPFYNAFMRVLGEGRPLGVHVVATADRPGSVPTAVSANVTKRIVLRLSDESGYQVLGVPKDVLTDRTVPGRGIVEGCETQLAVPGGSTNVAEQSKAIDRVAERLRAAGVPDAAPIGALPTDYAADALPATVSGEPVLGIADDTLAPIGFDPVGTFVVTGPPQSGKTTAVRAIIESLQRFDPEVRLIHIAGRRAALTDAAGWMRSATTVDDVRSLAKELVEIVTDETIPGRIAIVVESANQFADTEAERPMKELLQAVNRSDHFLVAEADVATLTGGFGFVGDIKASRRGIALKPDAFDGDAVFKTAFPKVKRSDFPEGRGIFVQNGRTAVVQLPHATESAMPDRSGSDAVVGG